MSVACVVAYSLWVLSLTLMAVSWFWDADQVARLSLLTCGAAVTATIRTYFIGLGHRIKAAMVGREGPPVVTTLR